MSSAVDSTFVWDAVRLAERFSPIPLHRICTDPAPGMATEEDVTWFDDHRDRLYELVGGILVEKTMGAYESMLAIEIAAYLIAFVKPRKLGVVLGADGTLKLAPGLVRIPDVCFISREKFPDGRFPRAKRPLLAPDLAVEELSESNTRKEMAEKLADYFKAGTRLVWYVDPVRREATVFTSVTESRLVTEGEALDGGEVLPGFSLTMRDLFSEELSDSEQ
jgi:Uma2 family endonuclease